jgi:hypothetical protein
MNQDKSSIVPSQKFPDHFASDLEKQTYDFGLKVGKAIQYEWFDRNRDGCRFYDRMNEFHLRRLYARGIQPIHKYKDWMKVNGDLSLLNLNWTLPPVMNKFVDIISNKLGERLFEPKVYAHDATVSSQRSMYQRMLEIDMAAKEFLEMVERDTGINAFSVDPEEIPENDEEKELHMQLKFKPKVEMAAEVALANILDMNDFREIMDRYKRDIIELGMGVKRHEYVPGSGIRVRYVDPEFTVHSLTEDPHFEDVFYWGEVKQIPIVELNKINPNLTPEEIDEISECSQRWYDEYSVRHPYRPSVFDKDVVNVMYFSYKTTQNFVYKKKRIKNGGERVIAKDDQFNPPQEEQVYFERLEKKEECWYSGVMVLGSEKILKWELEKNMVKPNSDIQKAYSVWIAEAPNMYRGRIDSIVSRSMPYIDLFVMAHFKLQQVVQKVNPDGVYIDADGLNEIDLGNGAAYTAQDALNLFWATGSVIGRSYTIDGEYNHGKVPIQEINNNSGQAKIASIINLMNYYLEQIREVIGVPRGADASSPDPDSLVGTQKLASLNSAMATKHILNSCLYATERLCEGLMVRISDILQYSDEKEEFANMIGSYNVDILDSIKELPLHSFGIYIEVSPDEEERAYLEQNIQMALSRDQISLDDVIDIRNIRNVKIANELLKLKKKKKERADQENRAIEMQMQAQNNMASQQAAAEAKMAQINAETQSKVTIINAEIEGSMRKLQFEAELKRGLMNEEFQFNMQLKGVEVDGMKSKETMKEDRKDSRAKMEATQQSKITDQRAKGLPPINFESSEDSLDGFDLSSFDPK